LPVSNLDIRPHPIEREEGDHQGVVRACPDDKGQEQQLCLDVDLCERRISVILPSTSVPNIS
jgi:hypothetical protein